MSDGFIVAVGATVATVITAVGGAIGAYLALRQKHKREDLDATITGLQGVISHLRGENERQALAIRDQQITIDQLVEEHSQCQTDVGVIYTWLEHVYSAARKWCRQSGGNPAEDLPPLPPRPARRDAEFRHRSTQQAARLASPINPTPQPQNGNA
jgi:hypothetical protein